MVAESTFWRSAVADEGRVPERAPLKVVRSEAADVEEDWGLVRSRVEAREEELWLVSSDSKFYARWCLCGATPMAKAKEGVVLIGGHPKYLDAQLAETASMNSRLMLALADELQTAGVPTIRFDYRGTGQSKGTFETAAAVRDIVAAANALCGTSGTSGPCEESAFVAASFGAASALGNVYTKGCRKFVSISHGLGFGTTRPDGTERPSAADPEEPSAKALAKLYNRTNIFFTTMRITIPKLWVVGTEDHLTPRDELLDWLSAHSPGKGDLATLHEVQGADHQFRRKERVCAKIVAAWLRDPTVKPIEFHFDFATGPVDHVFS